MVDIYCCTTCYSRWKHTFYGIFPHNSSDWWEISNIARFQSENAAYSIDFIEHNSKTINQMIGWRKGEEKSNYWVKKKAKKNRIIRWKEKCNDNS